MWNSTDTVLCDLDGVVWLAHEPIPGSVEAIERIRSSGRRVLFVTNNSSARLAEQEAALARIGIDATGDVVSSSVAGARLIEPGERVLVAGGPGVVEAVERRGAEVVLNDGSMPIGAVDAVIVGLHRDFDFDRLARTTTALQSGARLVATNDDATFPTPLGPEPGGGSLVAAVATAGQAEPIVAGKPHRPMADLIASMLRPADGAFDPSTLLMVGDRPETDGLFAGTLGCPFAMVRSGVVPPGAALPADVVPELDVADLAAVAEVLTASGSGDG